MNEDVFLPLYLRVLHPAIRAECDRILTQCVSYVDRFPEKESPKVQIRYKQRAAERNLLYFVQLVHRKTVEQVKLQLVHRRTDTGELELSFHGLLLALFQLMVDKKWLMSIIGPRDHAKSINFSTFGFEWLGVQPKRGRGVNPEMAYTSASSEYAISRGAYILNDFETNPHILTYWGELKGRIWNQDHIQLANGVHMYFKGYGKQTRGPHPWFTWLDDLESRKTAESATLTQKVKDWFNYDFFGQLEPGDLVGNSATNCGPSTFSDELHRDPATGFPKAGFTTFRFPACTLTPVNEKHVPEYPGDLPYLITDAIWSNKFSNQELKKKLNTIGPYAFEAEYQGTPHGIHEPVIRMEWIRQFEIAETELPAPSDCHIYIAFDPAYSTKTWADPTGWCELWVPQVGKYKNHFIIYDADHRRMTTGEKIDLIYQMQDFWQPKQISLEKDGDHGVLVDTIIRESVARKSYPNVVGIPSGGKDKVLRASCVQALFQGGIVHFIRGKNQQAKEELTRIQDPKYPDDIADAIVYNVKVAQTRYMPEEGSKVEAAKPEPELTSDQRAALWRQERFQHHLKHTQKGKLLNPITGEPICLP